MLRCQFVFISAIYTMKPIRKIVAALLIAIASAGATQAGELVWHLVTDDGAKYPINQIEYIIQQTAEDGFDIMLADGSVRQGVMRSSFEYCEDSGIGLATADREVVAGPYGDEITVSGLKVGAEIALFNTQGVLLKSIRVTTSSPVVINLASLPSGVYLLKTTNTLLKFLKR